MKKISIIVPVYNAENTIEKTIKSVLKNKRNDIELILVIDGSTDNSLKICTKMKELDKLIENKAIEIAQESVEKVRKVHYVQG